MSFNRHTVTRIVLLCQSGEGDEEELAFSDRLTITPHAITYHYKPECETTGNPVRRWRYETSSEIYTRVYEMILDKIKPVLEQEPGLFMPDFGRIDLCVDYSDRDNERYNFILPSKAYRELTELIRELVPETEFIPPALLHMEDFLD